MTTKTTNDQILRVDAVSYLTSMSRTSIYRAMNRGDFPRPIRLGERAIGWKMREVRKWLDERKRA